MERLTFEGNFCDIAQCRDLPCKYGGNCTQKEVWERLKQFEDAVQTPEKAAWAKETIEMAFSDDPSKAERLRELYKADKDGRVVVLPCKPGNHIFAVGPHKIMECKVSAIYQGAQDPVACAEFDCDSDCNGCPFYAPLSDPEGDFRCRGEWGEAEINFAKFGKTVFLTRKEAEKALQEMEAAK